MYFVVQLFHSVETSSASSISLRQVVWRRSVRQPGHRSSECCRYTRLYRLSASGYNSVYQLFFDIDVRNKLKNCQAGINTSFLRMLPFRRLLV